jgi:serine/threonine protein kinase/tetratricopeptide (TPR) repeat protein
MATYHLLTEIGRGAMGIVFKALQVELRREVAIKLLYPQAVLDQRALDRFESEASTLGRLDHPHIVRIYDVGVMDGQPYIAMELVVGSQLGDILEKRGALPLEEIAGFMAQAADALASMHSGGITHRDVKPANLMVSSSGHLTLMDFGLAKPADGPALTAVGELVGSLRFLAPECLSQPSQAAADVYALGITALELVLGRPWIEDATGPSVCSRIQQGIPARLAAGLAQPKWFTQALERALAPDPGARISAADFQHAMESQAKFQPAQLHAVPARPSRSRKARVTRPARPQKLRTGLRATLVILVAAALFGGLVRNRIPRGEPVGTASSSPTGTSSPPPANVRTLPWPTPMQLAHFTEAMPHLAECATRLKAGGKTGQQAAQELQSLSPIDLGPDPAPWIDWLDLRNWLASGGSGTPPRSYRALKGFMDDLVIETMFLHQTSTQVVSNRRLLAATILWMSVYPDDGRSWLYLGELLDMDGWANGARSAYAQALDRLTSNQLAKPLPGFWGFLIRALWTTTDPSPGEVAFTRPVLEWAGRAGPAGDPWTQLEIYFARSEPALYATILEEGAAQARTAEFASVKLGELRAKSGDLEQAIAVWRVALAKFPKSAALRKCLGIAQLRQGHMERARDIAGGPVVELLIPQERAPIQLSILLDEGQVPEAARQLEHFRKAYPELDWIPMELAFLGASGGPAWVEEEVRSALLAEPDRAHWLAAAGELSRPAAGTRFTEWLVQLALQGPLRQPVADLKLVHALWLSRRGQRYRAMELLCADPAWTEAGLAAPAAVWEIVTRPYWERKALESFENAEHTLAEKLGDAFAAKAPSTYWKNVRAGRFAEAAATAVLNFERQPEEPLWGLVQLWHAKRSGSGADLAAWSKRLIASRRAVGRDLWVLDAIKALAP